MPFIEIVHMAKLLYLLLVNLILVFRGKITDFNVVGLKMMKWVETCNLLEMVSSFGQACGTLGDLYHSYSHKKSKYTNESH